tara:strand:+ start:7698 stop:10439 length:2742 start_codon:yes stop_codon:yes gene_type:complete
MAVIDLPSNPSNNELFITQGKAMRYNSAKNKWKQVSTISSAQVAELEAKTIGVSSMSVTGNTLVIQKSDSSYANVSLSAFAGNILTNYASASQLPITGLVSGTQVYVTDTDSLYITDGSGWFKIATVNLSPSLSLGVSSISMGSGDSVDVSYTVNEPEDTPYTITASATSNASITVHQANNTITFDTPVQDTSETITISATDGVNTVADTLTMTIQFTFDWSNGVQQAKLIRGISHSSMNQDSYGQNVSLSEDGNYAIIGSHKLVGGARGYIHFWTRSGSTWTRGQTLQRTGGHSADRRGFGDHVVMSADGTLALVPAVSDIHPTGGASMSTGVVYLFTRTGSVWTQYSTLSTTGGNIINDMKFGSSVDISKDNNYIVVGASGQKAIYIFTNDGSNNFTQTQKTIPSNNWGDGYGASVAIDGDGDTVFVTHFQPNRGHIYTRSGSTWSEQQNFTPTDGQNIGAMESGGKGVAISEDGNTIAMADYNNNSKSPVDGSNSKGGAVLIWTRSGSTWTQQAKIIPSDPVGFNSNNVRQLSYGGVDLSHDGTILSTSTTRYTSLSGNETGRAYVYQKSETPIVGSLLNASYVHKSTQTWQAGMSGDVNANQPHTLAFKPDGTKVYIADANSDLIYQYNLSTPYDVTDASMSYDGISFNLRTSMGNTMLPASMKFKPDGTKLFVLNESIDTVYEYNLSTPYDLSTISYNNVNIAIGSVEGFPEGIFFKPDGTIMYVVGVQHDSVRMMDLSTPWDISTATYNSANSFSVNNQDSEPMEVIFDSSGTKMYMVGQATKGIYSYTLSSAWDVTTAIYDNKYYSMASGTDVNGAQKSIALSADADANKLFVVGIARDEVNRIDLPLEFTWSQQVKLSSSDIESNDKFGKSNALSGDGSTLIVGAVAEDNDGNTDNGAVYTFVTT